MKHTLFKLFSGALVLASAAAAQADCIGLSGTYESRQTYENPSYTGEVITEEVVARYLVEQTGCEKLTFSIADEKGEVIFTETFPLDGVVRPYDVAQAAPGCTATEMGTASADSVEHKIVVNCPEEDGPITFHTRMGLSGKNRDLTYARTSEVNQPVDTIFKRVK